MKRIDRLQQHLEIFIFFKNRRIDFPKMHKSNIYKEISTKFNISYGGVLNLFETKDLESTYLQIITKEKKSEIKNIRRQEDYHPTFTSIGFGSEKAVPRIKHKRTPTYYDDNNINIFEYLWDHT